MYLRLSFFAAIVGNITDCRLFFSQMVDYGAQMKDKELTLGNGSSCQKLSLGGAGFGMWGVNHKQLSVSNKILFW